MLPVAGFLDSIFSKVEHQDKPTGTCAHKGMTLSRFIFALLAKEDCEL